MSFSLYARGAINSISAIPPQNNDPVFAAGIYTKLEPAQQGNATYFPANFTDSEAQKDSVFGQLARKTWYRGTMYETNWGEIETSPGVFDWAELDHLMNTVRDLYTISGRASSQDKKVLLFLTWKFFGLSATTAAKMMPPDLLTTGTAYGNGWTKYHNMWAFNGAFSDGYQWKLENFRSGLTGNDAAGKPIYTLRDRYLAFLTALYNRYKDNPAFGGFVNTEAAGTPAILTSEYNRSTYFGGRLQLLKDMKTILTKHFIADGCNSDNTWANDMAGSGAAIDGMIANRIAFDCPNYHLGTNSTTNAIYYAMDNLANKVVIINQCQGLDQDSKTGQFRKDGVTNDVYDFLPNPPGYGSPRATKENPGWFFNSAATPPAWEWITHDPPNMPWVIARAQYLKTNIFIYQHNYATTGNKGAPRFNWADFVAAMDSNTTVLSPNTNALIQNDPNGGMNSVIPTWIV